MIFKLFVTFPYNYKLIVKPKQQNYVQAFYPFRMEIFFSFGFIWNQCGAKSLYGIDGALFSFDVPSHWIWALFCFRKFRVKSDGSRKQIFDLLFCYGFGHSVFFTKNACNEYSTITNVTN